MITPLAPGAMLQTNLILRDCPDKANPDPLFPCKANI